MTTVDFLIREQDFSELRARPGVAPPLAAGQVRVAVDLFSLSANNITYAAFGDAGSYWRFFPSGEAGWGIVPVWGFATVTESTHDGVAVGERLYGFWPMASHAVMTPGRVSPLRLVDATPHRTELPAAYNAYFRCAADPQYTPDSEAVQAVLRPLFITSWLVADFLIDNDCFGALWEGQATVLLSSASSKTAYGTAFCLAQQPNVRVVGLTSPRNRAFCQRLGCYDEVLAYDELAALPPDLPLVYVDFTGDAAVTRAVHEHLQGLRHSLSVGYTRLDRPSTLSVAPLPGPPVTVFFAPAQIKKRTKEWGHEAFTQRMADVWHAFRQQVGAPPQPWLSIQEHRGADAVAQIWGQLLAGQARPDDGHVVRLG